MIVLKADGSWKSLLSKHLPDSVKQQLLQKTQAEAGDLLLLAAGAAEGVVS